MPITYNSLLLRNQADIDRRITEDHIRLAREAAIRMIHYADSEGKIPDRRAVRRAIDNDVWSEVLKPYYIGSGDEPIHGIDPQSPYARVVVDGIRRATRVQVERQAALVERTIRDPEVVRWLTGPRPAALMFPEGPEPPGVGVERFASLRDPETGRINFARARADLVRPRGFYDPFHRWVDPNGHVLSDRVWNTAGNARERIDRLMGYHIGRGTPAVEIAKELERFLTPGAAGMKTTRPYGVEGSYAARRLARTEITVAARRATVVSAAANPMVRGVQWRLSPQHPERDICDEYAVGGPDGDGIYPVDDVPKIPHPHCLCHQAPVTRERPGEIVDRLRSSIQSARADLLGALDPESAARLQGILNPEYLTDAIMNGTLDQSVRDAVIQVQQPAAVTPVEVLSGDSQPDTAPELVGDEVVFRKGDPPQPGARLNGIPFDDDPPPDWATIPDNTAFEEPTFDAKGKRTSSGIIMVEPDGRIWIVEPTNHFGGYEHTFPKGGVEDGLTMQQSALKETWEESGLRAEITGFVADAEGSTSVTRYYIGRRIGGNPWAMGWESQAVKLVTPERAQVLLNVERDRHTLTALRAMMSQTGEAPIAPGPEPAAPTGLLEEGFPDDLGRLVKVRDLGGSTGAMLMRDPLDGRQYVLKRGNDPGHLREEVAADRAYQALGVNVPNLHLYETEAGPVKLTEFIEGRSLKDLRANAPAAYERALKAVRKDFAADAVLGNWDVIGLDFDNILVGKGGKVWRIDNGGALRRRAQGQMKSDIVAWDQYVDEIWTMRDPRINSQAATVFGDLDYEEITKQLRRVHRKRAAVLEVLPDDLKPLMESRFELAGDLVKISNTFSKDSWQYTYIDEFSRHSVGLRKAGLIDKLPQKLETRKAGHRRDDRAKVTVYDENGKRWDDLRGDGSIIERMSEYMAQNGANYDIISRWAEKQAGDSWTSAPQALKHFLYEQRQSSADDFWWKYGHEESRHQYESAASRYGEETYQRTFTMWHAFNYEFARNVQFANNNHRRGLITLMRTENKDVIAMNNLKVGEKGRIKRGPAESASIYRPVFVHGTELTVQQVPHHRIVGNYFLERYPGHNNAMFMGDGENEFVAMLDGLETTYKESRYR